MLDHLNDKAKPYRAFIALALGVITIGFSPIFVQLADAPGMVSSFYRMGIGASLMVLPFLSNAKKNSPFDRKGIFIAVLGGFCFALDLSFWTTAIKIGTATIPTVLGNTAPIFVGLGSLLIFKETQNRRFWAGLAVAVLGAVTIIGPDLSGDAQLGVSALYSIIAAICYASYYLVTQRGRTYLGTISYFWITTASSAVFLLIINIIFNQSLIGYDHQTWLAFLLLGAIVQVLGWLAINYAQGYLPASVVSPTLLGQPIATALLAFLLLEERLSLIQTIGTAIVLTGVYLVHHNRQTASSHQQGNGANH